MKRCDQMQIFHRWRQLRRRCVYASWKSFRLYDSMYRDEKLEESNWKNCMKKSDKDVLSGYYGAPDVLKANILLLCKVKIEKCHLLGLWGLRRVHPQGATKDRTTHTVVVFRLIHTSMVKCFKCRLCVCSRCLTTYSGPFRPATVTSLTPRKTSPRSRPPGRTYR